MLLRAIKNKQNKTLREWDRGQGGHGDGVMQQTWTMTNTTTTTKVEALFEGDHCYSHIVPWRKGLHKNTLLGPTNVHVRTGGATSKTWCILELWMGVCGFQKLCIMYAETVCNRKINKCCQLAFLFPFPFVFECTFATNVKTKNSSRL